MTDREIIQALECCRNDFSMSNCLDCPYNKEKSAKCITFMIEDALALILRQQAEIERLQEKCSTLEYDIGLMQQEKFVVEAEAIKACAGRLYDAFSAMQREYRKVLDSSGAEAMLIAQKVLKHYEKEMVGEQK